MGASLARDGRLDGRGRARHRTRHAARVPAAACCSAGVGPDLPGTRLYDISVRNGYLPRDFRFEDATYSRGVISTPDWTADQVQKLCNAQLLKYQIRADLRHPAKILKAMRNDPAAVLRTVGKVWMRVWESFKNKPIAFPHKQLTDTAVR